jgi:hypothetical protein
VIEQPELGGWPSDWPGNGAGPSSWGRIERWSSSSLSCAEPMSSSPEPAGGELPAGLSQSMLAALRGVLKECWHWGLLSTDDYQAAAGVKAVRGESEPGGRDLSAGELRPGARLSRSEANLGVRPSRIR